MARLQIGAETPERVVVGVGCAECHRQVLLDRAAGVQANAYISRLESGSRAVGHKGMAMTTVKATLVLCMENP